MNLLKMINEEVTMCSFNFLTHVINPARKAAGENGVRNRDFVARIEDECDDLGASEIFVRFGNDVKSYNLTMEQMTLVGMRESKAVRRSVLDTLKAMKKPEQSAPLLPATYLDALKALVASEEEKQIAQQQLAIAAPKAEFVDRYVDATGTYGFRQAAKILGVKENWFADFLIDKEIMYRLNKKLTAYSGHADAGRFVSRVGVGKNEHAFTESRFTAKGLQWVSGEIAKKRTEISIAKK